MLKKKFWNSSNGISVISVCNLVSVKQIFETTPLGSIVIIVRVCVCVCVCVCLCYTRNKVWWWCNLQLYKINYKVHKKSVINCSHSSAKQMMEGEQLFLYLQRASLYETWWSHGGEDRGEDRDSMFLWNVGNYLQVHTVLLYRRPA
jgi:hypothetical protein